MVNEDILKSFGNHSIKTIGFKLEMDDDIGIQSAKKMQQEKNLSGVFLNILKDKEAFGSNEQPFSFVNGEHIKHFDKAHKLRQALRLLEHLENELS